MKKVISVLVGLLFTALAVYVGLWVMFIGGIVGGIEAIKVSPVDSWGIAVNLVKVFAASFIGYLIFVIGLGVSYMIVGKPFKRKNKFFSVETKIGR